MAKTTFNRPPNAGAPHPADNNRAIVNSRGTNKATNTQVIVQAPGGNASTSISAAPPLQMSGNTVSIPQATATISGYLLAADWGTFNAKEPGLGNPSVSGYLLASTTGGVRSWVAPGSGSGQPLYPTLTPPVTGSMTWLNQGSATITTTSQGYGALRVPAAAGDILHGLYQSLPVTPYTITMAFFLSGKPTTSRQGGLMLYSTVSGKLKLLQFSAINQLAVSNWSDATHPGTNDSGPSAVFVSGAYWVRIADDGTTRAYSYSSDGESYVDFYSEATNTYVTPDSVGFYADTSDTNSDAVITVLSFTVV